MASFGEKRCNTTSSKFSTFLYKPICTSTFQCPKCSKDVPLDALRSYKPSIL
uniref:Methyltransferase n=1 Tax=Arundo donax TaxID=35708 RepID=A0A0A9FL35_ARUDO